MALTCVERIKNRANEIVLYKVKDNSGKVVSINSAALKDMLRKYPDMVDNLTLSTNNRIVASKNVPTSKMDKSNTDLIKTAIYRAYMINEEEGQFNYLEMLIINIVKQAKELGITKLQVHEFLTKSIEGIKDKHLADVNRNAAIANRLAEKLGKSYRISADGMALIMYLTSNFKTGQINILRVEDIEPADYYEYVIELFNVLKED